MYELFPTVAHRSSRRITASSSRGYMGFSIVGQILYYLTYAPLNGRIYPPFATHPPDVPTLTEHIYHCSLAALLHYQNPAPPRKPRK